jgi:DNA-binding NtrC family response regulator
VVRRALERRALEREVVFLRSELARRYDEEEIVGQHVEMQKIYRLIAQVARTTTTVLITGESGTGKELIARAIHRQGPRRDRPFVAVNPGAVPETLIESELFGHEKGAFTGAYQRKIGKFEMAQGGTLFLDEIGTLKADLQVKLLRVLQEREIERVGGTHPIKIDVRIVAATNADLKAAINSDGFRRDLYYRLNVVAITVPPLRERRQDIPALAERFIRRYNDEFGKRVGGLSSDALAALTDYSWPGNVRELQNVIERCVVLADGPRIELNDLPMDVLLPDHRARVRDAEALPLHEATEEFERQIVLRVLERVRWNRSEAARILGVHRNSLKAKLVRWRLLDPSSEQ